MNSAEEISKYHDHNSHYCSPVLARRTGGTSYDFPEKSPKKDKKWSLGSLFRRKKKPGSESSSEEDPESKNFLQKKKKKPDKRKRTNKTIGFDHVVIPSSSRHTTLTNGYKNHEDPAGVLSEPSYPGRTVSRNFIPASDFTSRLVPLKDSEENGLNRSNNSLGSPSVSSLGRRKKEVVKARAAARRDTSKGEESSDEDSQRSAFKSDDSLTKPRDGSLSRRSRAARTQRYLKRRSKDEEGHEPLRASKSDVEHHDHARNVQHLRLADERIQNMKSASKSPILSTTPKSKLSYTNSAPPSRPNFSGLSTIPPSQSSQSKYRTISVTNGSSLHKQSSSFHDYNDTGNKSASADLNNQRSLSCGANIHNAAPSPENVDEVVHVQFPLGKPFNKRPNLVINQQLTPGKRQPPPPPPRDPRRILTVQNSDGRPISYSFENGYQSKNGSDQQLNKPPVTGVNRNFNLNPSCRSTSEDHISLEPSQRIPLVPRPSSATPEANRLHKLGKSYLEKNPENPNGYRYLTDKNPRSRKPICIQSCTQVEDAKPNLDQQNKPHKPFEFWKQKDEEVARANPRKSTPGSPLMFTAQTHVRTNIFLPNGMKIETDPSTMNGFQRESSPFRPITSPKPPSPNSVEKISNGSLDETELMQRKSSNLEDALDELEAIYNSLHLGDEDLLERAEQREAAAAQKRRDAAFESFPNSVARGTLSDSSFGYDPNFEISRKKRHLRRTEPDRKADDMAFRKLNKERYNTINDPQANAPRASYLLTSPVFNTPVDDVEPQKDKGKNKEPDVTYDDVVYRNVKHTNNALKVAEPQPPFGIPIGPILPASNSDYLHATPEVSQRFTFKPRKIPDVVKDDLAYRNLRKDANKEPALPQSTFSHEDYLNNNNKSGETSKKKRAVRSLSANIYNLMQRDWKPIEIPADDEVKDQNIGDVADALEIARKILKEKEQKISATRKAFMSDGELKYRKFERSSPTEQRINFLNEMRSSNSLDNENVYHHKLQVSVPVMDYDRLEAKPPTPDRSRRSSRPSTKESTPIPTSPSEEGQIKKQGQQSTLDELLTSLAVQARETSDRITNELKMYEEEKERKQLENGLVFNPEKQKKILIENRNINGVRVYGEDKFEDEETRMSVEKLEELEKDAISASLNLQLTEADSTSDHAKLCEKLLECVVDSTELLAATKDEQEPLEEVTRIHIEPPFPETVANVILTPTDKSKLEVNPSPTEVFSESDHDYVNIQSNDAETETDTDTTKDAPKGNVEIEIGSSTEMDEEERELLIDDDTVSADICMSPLEKHKAELVAAFEELRMKDGSLMKIKKKDQNCIEQTEKGGGEECVSVQYIALPTKGCAIPTESNFEFNRVNQKEAERYLNVYNFDFDSGENEVQNYLLKGEDESFGTNPEIWINDQDALDSLKSPKLVKNINAVVTENYDLCEASGRNCNDSEQIVLGLGSCLKELESRLNLERNNILASDSGPININKFLDSQNDFDALSAVPSDTPPTRRDFRVDRNHDIDRNIESGENCPTLNSDQIRTNTPELDRDVFDSGQNYVGSSDDLKESFGKSVGGGLGHSKGFEDDKSKNSKSVTLRDSGHTLDEMRPSRSWYEDPAVVALACSCGIACTSQLPSFDIIAVLGLLFAIISLFIALITRT